MTDIPQPTQLEQKTDRAVLGSVNFNKKKQYSMHDLLQTLKSQAFKFNSFEELKKAAFELDGDNDLVKQALSLFLSEMAQTLSFMFTGAPAGPDPALKGEEWTLCQQRILTDPLAFQETCRIYYNIQNLTEISLKLESGAKANQKRRKTVLRNKIRKQKDKTERKVEKKPQNIKPEDEKIMLRLVPCSTETHQLMMKMENFPRLELKVSPNNFLRNITEHLQRKWLFPSPNYRIDYYPDESKWLRNVPLERPQSKPSPLSENYMIADLYSAYDCPSNRVLYINYELSEKSKKKRDFPSLADKTVSTKEASEEENNCPLIKKVEEKGVNFANFGEFRSDSMRRNEDSRDSRKDAKGHLSKIKDLVDIVGRKYDKIQKK